MKIGHGASFPAGGLSLSPETKKAEVELPPCFSMPKTALSEKLIQYPVGGHRQDGIVNI